MKYFAARCYPLRRRKEVARLWILSDGSSTSFPVRLNMQTNRKRLPFRLMVIDKKKYLLCNTIIYMAKFEFKSSLDSIQFYYYSKLST